MTPTPMISVIVPFYNEYAYLENTILSVLFQTYKNLEILIVDDSGVHGAQTVIKNIKKDKRIRLLDYGENRGVSAARNFGLDNAKGDWVYFLDSDDFISSNFLERCITAAQFGKSPVAGIIRHINIPDKHIATFGSNNLDFVIYPLNSAGGKNAAAMHHQYIFSKKFLNDNNIRFCDGLVFGEDLLFYLLVAHYAKFACLTGGGFYYFRAPSSDKTRPYDTQDRKNGWQQRQNLKQNMQKLLHYIKMDLNIQPRKH